MTARSLVQESFRPELSVEDRFPKAGKVNATFSVDAHVDLLEETDQKMISSFSSFVSHTSD